MTFSLAVATSAAAAFVGVAAAGDDHAKICKK
jgi:hypothetical protein